jgi:hypothetical protein
LGDGGIEAHGARQVVGWHHLLDVAHGQIDQGALQKAKLVAHRAQHHMFDRCMGDALLQGGREVLDDDDGLGAGVLQLVLQFTWRVQRIDVDHHQARPQDRSHGHRVLRHIGHHDGNTVSLAQAQPLQVARKGAAQAVRLGIGDVLAHEAVRRPAGVLLEAFLHQCNQRRILRGIDVSRHTLGVTAQPDAIGHSKDSKRVCKTTYSVLKLTRFWYVFPNPSM